MNLVEKDYQEKLTGEIWLETMNSINDENNYDRTYDLMV